MKQVLTPMKVLFFDNDEVGFEFCQCMIRVLQDLPPVQLLHAKSADQAISVLEQSLPDVIVIDDEMEGETLLLLENLPENHPPIVLQSSPHHQLKTILESRKIKQLTVIGKNESLDGLHSNLLTISKIASESATAAAGLAH